MLGLKLEVQPVPVESIKKQKTANSFEENESIPDYYEVPKDKIDVYEVWKIFLEDNSEEIRKAYVVISAKFIVDGYKQGKWENIQYRGCYSTIKEAKNEIDGYLR